MSPDREALRKGGAADGGAPIVASREDDLLNAWDRLLAIAALYPPQNTRFLDAVREWREALAPMARADGSLCIEVGRDDRLAHEGRVQSPERVARSRLYPLLTGIGVEHILLSRDIVAEDLHRLIAILRETQQVSARSVGFQSAELPTLPAGVTVQLRSFGNPGELGLGSSPRERELGPGDGAGPGGSAPASTGPAGGEAGGEQGPEEALPAVSNPHVGVQSNLAQSLEERLTLEATTLYRSLTRDAVPETAPSPPAAGDEGAADAARAPRAPDLSPPQLTQQLARLATDSRFDAEQLGPSQPEWLALVLQLSFADEAGATRDRARAELARALGQELHLHELQILVTAGEGLLAAGDAERVDALLPLLLTPIAHRGEPLLALLSALAEGAGAARRELLWPHLADALLRAAVPASLAQVKGSDGETALALPAEARGRALARLEAQPALLAGRIAPAICRGLRAEMRPLLLALLHSSRGAVAGAQLRAALLESPPPAPYGGLIALLGNFKPSQREFYRLLLESEAGHEQALSREAAALALHALQRLSAGERRRPEVVDALLALVPAPPGDADALLAAVLSERRLFILPAWPAAARRQAALTQQRRRLPRGASARTEEARP